jgi:hypothetical protein
MSKLNPQKASAYVGPGVLRKGGKITPVPNGPLIKKKGPFKGSTLKTGGTIKKAQNGDTTKVATLSPYMQKRAAQDLVKQKNIRARDSIVQRNANAKGMTREEYSNFQKKNAKKPDVPRYEISTAKDARELARESNKGSGPGFFDVIGQIFTEKPGCIYTDEDKSGVKKRNGGPIKKAQLGSLIKKGVKKVASEIIPVAEKNLSNMSPKYNKKGLEMAIQRRVNPEAARKKMTPAQRRSFEVDDSYRKNGGPIKKAKAGAMIKRADGSMSKPGLWDNIRKNKGSGKRPTKQMLVQEKKIKAKSKK